MYGQNALGADGLMEGASRMYLMEVEGLRQNSRTSTQQFAIRRSGTVTLTVPYSRMSSEFQRITRLGGKIVRIAPVDAEAPAPAAPAEDE
ncbi:phycobilisome linker polypeptide [Spirulina sp. CCNP1310]|uniref:phycobilisome linker polypeptide n=1 Tax=Spirulina sp. CCNP1310 TaxID=3110249 RepID=UPI002B1FC069|nr:phycobilisome linker polypeptide [Spirulina sp. CCNP1310]MEA5418732.1 phycobilisome linker polypeptide [Spirulina sp. CCNP1310]